MTRVSWDAQRIERLKKLWQDGKTAAEIAVIFGDVSRNSVISRLHRSGFGERDKPANLRRRRRTTPRQARPASSVVKRSATAPKIVAQPAPPPIDDAAISIVQRRELADLDARCCHWPVGHPGEPDFFFCGAPVSNSGEPYCTPHRYRAIRAPKEGARTDGWR